MNTGTEIPAALVRSWVRAYTAGMPPDLRSARRAEIDADLWDHQEDARVSEVSRGVAALEILLRALRGIPDDVKWRFEASTAHRTHSSERKVGVMDFSKGQIRWMGLAGVLGGLAWAANAMFLVPNRPDTGWLAYGHLVIAMLFPLGLIGFYAPQHRRTGKVGFTGFVVLLTSFTAWLAAIALGLLGISDKSLAMNLLGAAFVLLLAPGFLLLGFGIKDPARRVPLGIGGVFLGWLLLPKGLLIQFFPWAADFLSPRGDSPLGRVVFCVMGIGLALMGYFALRKAAPQPESTP